MPLNPAALTAELTRIFKAKVSNPQTIAKLQADAYAQYARAATAAGTLPVFLGSELFLMQPILFGAIAVPAAGNPITYAAGWSAAVASFWSLPPIAFAGAAGTGVSAPPIGAALLTAAIAAIVSVPTTSEIAASGIAAALHAATLTVIVTGLTPLGAPFSAPLI